MGNLKGKIALRTITGLFRPCLFVVVFVWGVMFLLSSINPRENVAVMRRLLAELPVDANLASRIEQLKEEAASKANASVPQQSANGLRAAVATTTNPAEESRLIQRAAEHARLERIAAQIKNELAIGLQNLWTPSQSDDFVYDQSISAVTQLAAARKRLATLQRLQAELDADPSYYDGANPSVVVKSMEAADAIQELQDQILDREELATAASSEPQFPMRPALLGVGLLLAGSYILLRRSGS